MKKIVILGGGISGLATAWFLSRRFKNDSITLLESSDRFGGWIRTVKEGDFLFEVGPRGFRPSGKGQNTLSLIQELGIEKELIFADESAKRRFIYLDGRLQLFSPLLLLKQGLLSALFKDFTTPPSQEDDESIYDFCLRRFNKKLTKKIVDPVVKGFSAVSVFASFLAFAGFLLMLFTSRKKWYAQAAQHEKYNHSHPPHQSLLPKDKSL